MTLYRFEHLDLQRRAVREEYEQLFYSSFLKVSANRLIHTLWAWDHHARRLATRIAYAHQIVFGVRNSSGRLESAIAFNLTLQHFQAAAFGFRPPRDSAGCCEILTFFSRHSNLKLQLDLWSHCRREMTRLGFHTAWATTARRPLKSYLRIGWKLIAQAEINGEERFFLLYDFAPAVRPPRVLTNGNQNHDALRPVSSLTGLR